MAVRSTKELMMENPLKSAATIVSSLAVLLGAVFAVDSRYAHADDVKQYKSLVAADLLVQTKAMERQNVIMRRQYVEDKMFELDAKRENGRLNATEEAMYRRFDRQLTELKDASKLK